MAGTLVDHDLPHHAVANSRFVLRKSQVTQDHRVAGWARAVRSERLMLKQAEQCLSQGAVFFN